MDLSVSVPLLALTLLCFLSSTYLFPLPALFLGCQQQQQGYLDQVGISERNSAPFLRLRCQERWVCHIWCRIQTEDFVRQEVTATCVQRRESREKKYDL